jgi:hypothetical protein
MRTKGREVDDRRKDGIGHDDSVACRSCRTPVPLDRSWIRLRGGFTELACHRCGLVIRVRRTDASETTGGAAEMALSVGSCSDTEPGRRAGPRWRRPRKPQGGKDAG